MDPTEITSDKPKKDFVEIEEEIMKV